MKFLLSAIAVALFGLTALASPVPEAEVQYLPTYHPSSPNTNTILRPNSSKPVNVPVPVQQERVASRDPLATTNAWAVHPRGRSVEILRVALE